MILSILPPSDKPPLVKRLKVLPEGLEYKNGWKLNGNIIESTQADSLFLGYISQEYPKCLDEGMQIHYLEESSPRLIQCVVNLLHQYANEKQVEEKIYDSPNEP